MARPSQFSFRRILLSRILLLSVPVLLIGEVMTLRKARSSLLETARWNLTESAVKKGESITNAIAALKTNLLVASQTTVLRSGSPKQAQIFLEQLASQLPQTHCFQLKNLQTSQLVASTCGNSSINLQRTDYAWNLRAEAEGLGADSVRVNFVIPQNLQSSTQPASKPNLNRFPGQPNLLLSAPIYNTGQLQYVLSALSTLQQKEVDQTRALNVHTIIIDQNGTILAHPIGDRIGVHMMGQADAERIKSLVSNAIARREDFVQFSFEPNGPEFLAGYSIIRSPVTNQSGQHWIVLAVTRLDDALLGLREIKVILIVLTLCLLGTSLLATFYISRDLAIPLEELRDYTLNLESDQEARQEPHKFKIREVKQLAEAVDRTVERLKVSVDELETAWQEAQASNQSKSEFLATTSHELRTPLNAIIGCIRLVRDDCCDDREEELEFLKRADEAAIHLLGIINDLLDIAKIEAGKLSVVIEPLDLRQILQEVIDLQAVHIQQKGLHLITMVESEPILVKADPAKLKQVLLNVIGNAVKFTQQGSITIKTQVESWVDRDHSNSTPQVVVTVKDTGIGIDPAQQHKLFRPFVMVDGTTTRKFGGTGLGLAISRNLMELMGGSITLSSAGTDQGTTVAIALPLLDCSMLPTPLRTLQSLPQVQPEGSDGASLVNEASLPEVGLSESIRF